MQAIIKFRLAVSQSRQPSLGGKEEAKEAESPAAKKADRAGSHAGGQDQQASREGSQCS
jgi:hypothetical protein